MSLLARRAPPDGSSCTAVCPVLSAASGALMCSVATAFLVATPPCRSGAAGFMRAWYRGASQGLRRRESTPAMGYRTGPAWVGRAWKESLFCGSVAQRRVSPSGAGGGGMNVPKEQSFRSRGSRWAGAVEGTVIPVERLLGRRERGGRPFRARDSTGVRGGRSGRSGQRAPRGLARKEPSFRAWATPGGRERKEQSFQA